MVDPNALANSFITDTNGDGIIQVTAFGDSITRGVGDFTPPGAFVEDASRPPGEAGYPLRMELQLGLPISNLGVPGDILSREGLIRFAAEVSATATDLVIISGGTNDAIAFITPSFFFSAIQTMINIAFAEGMQVALAGPPPTCCDEVFLDPFVAPMADVLKDLAQINDTPYADVRRGFLNTCGGGSSCFLLNEPEGVHPNTSGYDVVAEILIASLFSIDIFAPNGPMLLEQALGIAEGSVITQPDRVE
jgi:lysophospholipase L1-like esterase